MPEEQRFIDLEIKIAHQDKILEDLSDVIYKQQQKIDSLEKTLALINKRLASNAINELEIGPANDKPPHY